MRALIISFVVDIVLGILFLVRKRRNRITEKDFKETEHKEVVI